MRKRDLELLLSELIKVCLLQENCRRKSVKQIILKLLDQGIPDERRLEALITLLELMEVKHGQTRIN